MSNEFCNVGVVLDAMDANYLHGGRNIACRAPELGGFSRPGGPGDQRIASCFDGALYGAALRGSKYIEAGADMGWNGVNALEEAGSGRSGLSRVVGDVADAEANRGIEAVSIDDGLCLLNERVEVSRAESTNR